ncbi:MAG: hypothetical protein P8J32_07485 [bacterium]|nr:hypothetical protein [bacterium]
MRLSTQHKELSELVFFIDILDYFRNMDGYRELGGRFWHKSGTHYYQINPVNTSPTNNGGLMLMSMDSTRDERYAVVELHSSSVNYYFNSTWGHREDTRLITKILLAPKGPAPITPEINIDLNTIRIQGGSAGTWITGIDGSDLLTNSGPIIDTINTV